MKFNLENLMRFKFPLTEEEQAILLNEIDMMRKELLKKLEECEELEETWGEPLAEGDLLREILAECLIESYG